MLVVSVPFVGQANRPRPLGRQEVDADGLNRPTEAAAREFGPFPGAFLCPPSLINSASGFTIVSLSSHILEG